MNFLLPVLEFFEKVKVVEEGHCLNSPGIYVVAGEKELSIYNVELGIIHGSNTEVEVNVTEYRLSKVDRLTRFVERNR